MGLIISKVLRIEEVDQLGSSVCVTVKQFNLVPRFTEMLSLLPLLSFLVLLPSVSSDAILEERIVGGSDATLGLPLLQGFLEENNMMEKH